jgi:AraC family transcriptional regulator, transcriptional activator of pobA
MEKDSHDVISEYHLNRHQPDKMQFAIHDLGIYLQKHRENAAKPHIHSYYQIIWFRHGEGTHVVDFKEYNVSANSIFLISKNQVHYFGKGANYEGILIHFNEAFLVQKETEMDFFLKFNLFNNPYAPPSCCIDKSTSHILDRYILQIKDELDGNEDFAREELLRAYLKSFLIQVQRKKNEIDWEQYNHSFALDEKRLQLVKFSNLVEENYNKGLSVVEYARLLSISSRTLSDLTNQLINKTPSQIIQDRIILSAQRLLLHSSLNINQIGYRLGFDDPSYFVKFFKKHTNTSPSEFRKSIS